MIGVLFQDLVCRFDAFLPLFLLVMLQNELEKDSFFVRQESILWQIGRIADNALGSIPFCCCLGRRSPRRGHPFVSPNF